MAMILPAQILIGYTITMVTQQQDIITLHSKFPPDWYHHLWVTKSCI